MVRLEVRLESDVVKSLKRLSASAGVSVNQVMQGVCRWAADHAHVGVPVPDDGGEEFVSKPMPGVIWFGRDGRVGGSPPSVFFGLDFSSGRAVRDDWEGGAGDGQDQ
ncbi:MAG: hypothetical protein ABFD92_16485 [Planctomycetaceae bacterium]|nr:hypothetical protein [Planctomycetaceae bacterium]